MTSGETLEELFDVVERAKREWESAIDSLPDLVALIDPDGKIIRANRTVEEWQLGRVENVRGLALHQLLHPTCADPACYLAPLSQLICLQAAAGEPLDHETYDPILKRHVHVHVRPVFDRHQAPTHTTVVVVRDITERKKVELERSRLITDLDAYARTVAHDLKNPVTLIIGYAELLDLNMTSMSADEVRECIQLIMRVGQKLDKIIEELLLFAEIQDTEAELEPVDMRQITAEAFKRIEDLAAQRQAEITSPASWPLAMGQPQWVEEVWVNYISNALKYGGRPARIELGSELLANGQARFWVKDNGAGIKLQDQAELFTQRKQKRPLDRDSHGLGLSIVQRIIEKLGGEVGFTNNPTPETGCTFYFTLPVMDFQR
ncbi:MAG: ATP-binding protein [Anaerolineae bacterium]